MKCEYGTGTATAIVSKGISGSVVNGLWDLHTVFLDQPPTTTSNLTLCNEIDWKESASLNCKVPDWSASSAFLAAFSPRYLASIDIHIAVTNEVLRIITSTKHTVTGIIETHAAGIGIWLKCISIPHLMARVDTMQSEPSSDLALLILLMYLCVQIPSPKTSNDSWDGLHMQTSIYYTAKALLSPVLASGTASLHNTQAALLLALYEYGHAMFDAAQMTMAGCGRLGMKVLAKKRRQGGEAVQIQETEEGRLWWSIIILDRCALPLHSLSIEDMRTGFKVLEDVNY